MKKLMAMTNFLCLLVLLSGCGGSRNQNSQPADKMKIPNYITPPVHRIVKEPTGPKVKITAFIDTPSFSGDEDFFIHEDCENLIIGGMPMTINRIRGLEKLTKVKRLVLYVICDQGGGPSDVTDYITQLKNVEVLTI